MHVTIETPGSRLEKWRGSRRDAQSSEAEALGFVLGAALYAVGPMRLDEVLGHCIVRLDEYGGFGVPSELPAVDALKDLCDASRRIVEAWKRHDQTLNEG